MKSIKWYKQIEIGVDENGESIITLAPQHIDSTNAGFANDYAIAKAEAYNGEVTVEDDEQPEPPPTTEQRVSYLEEQLTQSDETAIALYEAQEAQEVINSQQDEALMEIYEMIG